MSKEVGIKIKQSDYTVGIVRVDKLDKGYDGVKWFNQVIDSVVMFEVVDSMEMHYKTGRCVIRDPTDIRKITPFTGNEVITIKYRNSYHGAATADFKYVHFRIFGIQEIQDDQKPNQPFLSYLTLNLIEFPAFEMFSVPHVYKTWDWEDDGKNPKGVVVSDAVRELLQEVHNFDKWWDLDIDDTTNQDEDKILFYSPNWTIVQSVDYLKQFAQKKGKKYPNYFFKTEFPEKEGGKPKILFKSVYTKLEKNNVRPYQTQRADQMFRPPITGNKKPDNPKPEDGDTYDVSDTILQYNFDWGNANQLFTNISGETLINWDMENSVNYMAYDFETFIRDYKGLGFYGTWLEKPAREDKGVQWNRFYACPWKKKKQIENFMKNSMYRKYFNNAIKVHTKCYINGFRRAGEKVRLSFTRYNQEEKIDSMFSGNWMCWEIRDIIHGSGESVSEVTFLKDTFFLNPKEPSNYMKKVDSFDDGRLKGRTQ